MMASKKQATQKRDPGKPPAVANRGNPDDPAWYLSRGAMAFRDTAERDPDQRVEADAMAKHLYLLCHDPDYRSAALAGVAKHLDGNPAHAPVKLPRQQALDFLRPLRANLEHYAGDTRGATIQILCDLGMYPLILGDTPSPKLTEDVIDKTERKVKSALDRSENQTATHKRKRDERVAKAVLRAVGVDSDTVRKLYP